MVCVQSWTLEKDTQEQNSSECSPSFFVPISEDRENRVTVIRGKTNG